MNVKKQEIKKKEKSMQEIEMYYRLKPEILKFIYINQEKIGREKAFEMMLRIESDILIRGEAIFTPTEFEIFSKFGLIPKELDPYENAYNMLKEENFLHGNIVEVASGSYPRLSEIIAQKTSESINLTTYDPKLILDTLSGVTLRKEKFTEKTNIKNIDTIFGIFPCEATIPILEQGFENNANIFLAFCGCNHASKQHPLWFGSIWAEDVIDDYKEQYGSEIEIKYWPKEANINYPILVRKRK